MVLRVNRIESRIHPVVKRIKVDTGVLADEVLHLVTSEPGTENVRDW